MSAFARYFHLKKSTRTSFLLNTSKDAEIFVDLDNVQKLARASLGDDNPAPMAVYEGDFGSGKTHLLRNIERVIAPELNFEPLYLKLSGFKRRSDFFTLHKMLLPKILDVFKPVLWDAGESRVHLFTDERLNPDIVHALRDLSTRPIDRPPEAAVNAESWLLGNLSPARTVKAGYSSVLFERSGPTRLVELYKALADFHHRQTDRRLLLLLDEGESFTQVVDEDAQASIGQGLRELFDSENDSLGLILGLTTPRSRGGTHPMLRADVRSRIGPRYTKLDPLHTAPRRRRFIQEIWKQLAKPGTPPFMLSEGALDYLVEELETMRQVYPEAKMAASTTPRDLLNVLTKMGRFVIDPWVEPPITRASLRAWFPAE